MLGSDLVKVLSLPALPAGRQGVRYGSEHDVIGLSHQELDVTEKKDVEGYINSVKPNVVIHAAANTDVDGCESNRELAFLVNAEGTKNVALTCQETGSVMVYVSTDYVFDGAKDRPYTEKDEPHPLNIYGESKLAGENHVRSILKKYYIVRTSWLFGKSGKNFVDTILHHAKEEDKLKVVDDQVGSPTYTPDLAKAISKLIEKPSFGYYHVSNQGSCSWYDFALEILGLSGLWSRGPSRPEDYQPLAEASGRNDIKVMPVPTEEIKRPAARPKYSVLDCRKYINEFGCDLRDWQSALKDYLIGRS